MPFYLKMSQNLKITTRHLKFSYISIFYSSSMERQWNKECKNYIQLDQLKKIKAQRVDSRATLKCYEIEVKKFPMYK